MASARLAEAMALSLQMIKAGARLTGSLLFLKE